MSATTIARLEKILGRTLEQDEKDRLLRIKDILQLADNDAMWDLLVAMEYQRTYYEAIPAKINEATTKAVQDISTVAEKEVTIAQSQLADAVITQSKNLSQAVHTRTWITWGIAGLALLLMYGSLTMWAGYCIGAGQAKPPAFILKMPIGVLAGMASLCAGGCMGAYAAKAYSEGRLNWRKQVLPAIGCLGFGALIACLTLTL